MLEAPDDFDDAALDPDAPETPSPPAWTPDHVGHRLVEAMRTLDRLPRPKGPRTPGNHWPQHRLEWADKLAQAELPEAEKRERTAARLAELTRRPSGAEIDRMDHALDWLRDLRESAPELALVATLWAWPRAAPLDPRALPRARLDPADLPQPPGQGAGRDRGEAGGTGGGGDLGSYNPSPACGRRKPRLQ